MTTLAERSLALHAHYRGKIQSAPKVPVTGLADYNLWYTPGVAEPCLAIAAEPERVWELTNRGNTVAIVSDGTRVLGLGDIGPLAGLPVMEGKALIFKLLGGVDAVPLMLAVSEPDAFCATVAAVAPTFGGINLEDIAQPRCFELLSRLRPALDIPVWHDDQQGTATVALAAVLNALALVGKSLGKVRLALVGMGAANVAVYRLLKVAGADPGAIIACDAGGTLHCGRRDLEAQAAVAPQWSVCLESNAEGIVGGIPEALAGADVVLAFSRPGPDVIRPEWVTAMARDAIVIAGANPVPEIHPQAALAAGARIVGTGRSDFPNQVNNALAFPGIFRGVLDVQACTITDAMAVAAAEALAGCAQDGGVREDHILPTLEEPEVAVRVAVATGLAAQAEGVARRPGTAAELEARARTAITAAQRLALSW
ncbi:MAG TPA: NADP-dependent malic enzyme [Anaerolineae bacterium]|nr:NADP-dependent malic enzyme [Anaerolineae bacterium]HQM13949.1 NADP-dependent malic enzyme [Anaerolineae bacterium]